MQPKEQCAHNGYRGFEREATASRLPRGSLPGPTCLLGYGEARMRVAEEYASHVRFVRVSEERHDAGSESHDCEPRLSLKKFTTSL
jgi:hypothetical protein